MFYSKGLFTFDAKKMKPFKPRKYEQMDNFAGNPCPGIICRMR
jgi:hypothetical protein